MVKPIVQNLEYPNSSCSHQPRTDRAASSQFMQKRIKTCKICINDVPVFCGVVQVLFLPVSSKTLYLCVNVFYRTPPILCETVSALPPVGRSVQSQPIMQREMGMKVFIKSSHWNSSENTSSSKFSASGRVVSSHFKCHTVFVEPEESSDRQLFFRDALTCTCTGMLPVLDDGGWCFWLFFPPPG